MARIADYCDPILGKLEAGLQNDRDINEQGPSPLVWTKTARESWAALARFCKRTSESGH